MEEGRAQKGEGKDRTCPSTKSVVSSTLLLVVNCYIPFVGV